MIHINEAFTCQNCGKENPKADQTCRNHCKYCLYSKHVDAEIPGDRLSNCLSLMEPIQVEMNGKKGYQILHNCLKCKKNILNKAAPDDNLDVIIHIMNKQNINGPIVKDR